MDGYLRFFIKFHGYCIAIVSILVSLYFTTLASRDPYENLTLTIVFSVVGILWMVANVLLLAGIFKENKKLIYPFCAIYWVVLLLFIIVTIGPMIDNPWFGVIFFTPFFPSLIIMSAYIILSMKALIRLFDLELNSSSSESSEPALV